MKTLNYMDSETVSQIYARVSRERQGLEDAREADTPASTNELHAHLSDVEQALETVIGFLNGEHEAFRDARDAAKPDRSGREQFREGAI